MNHWSKSGQWGKRKCIKCQKEFTKLYQYHAICGNCQKLNSRMGTPGRSEPTTGRVIKAVIK